VMFPP